ncbi:MAG: FimV/HubP family polar landmark protein [Methylococcaceae bacterium]
MRNLTRTLAMVSLLAPAGAYPLGIGDIKLHSALNQKLNAEIPLILAPGEDISDVKISLAPPDKFDEAGVPWSYFLSKLQFEVVGTVIKVTSKEAIKEPLLDMVLEVKWPKGNLFRGFTLLVDPPATYQQATVPLSTRPALNTEASPQPRSTDYQPAKTRTRTPQSAVNGDEYGPTRTNDSLWRVAENARGDSGATVEQVAIAIYEANPQAFFKPNVNALMAGKTLKIPENDVILKLSKKQALDEFNQQMANWKNGVVKSRVIASATDAEQADNKLKLLAPTDAPVAENAEVTAGNVKTSPDKQKNQTKAGAKPNTAIEPNTSAKTTDPVLATMQEKIAALESQLAMMQKMVALKDEQLAVLQNQKASPDPANNTVDEAVTPAEPTPVEPASPANLATDSATNAVVGAETPATTETQAVAETPEPPKPVEPAPVEPKPIVAPAPVVAPVPDDETGYYLGLGGAGAAILSVLGWLWWRNKRKVEDEINAESIFASSSMIHVPDENELFSAPATANNNSSNYNVGTVGESSFLSEFTPSDFDAFDTSQGEIDPISEADVYLAYGRYQQAEELMRQAIKDQPNRDECKLKLFEIFYANENRKAFEDYAMEMAATGKNKDVEFWSKIVEMGTEMCPDAPIFSGQKQAESAAPEAHFAYEMPASMESHVIEQDDDFSLAMEKTDALETSPEEEDNGLDFDLSSFDLDNKVGQEITNDSSLDFDLDLESWLNKEEVAENIADASNTKKEFESFEFDMGEKLVEKDTAKIDNANVQAVTDDKIETIDFAGNDEFKLDDDLEELSLDSDFDFNFDFNELPGSLEEATAAEESFSFAVDDLTDMDEFETKLDLARAYIDMGDAEAARDIAEEVMEKGSKEQKKIAQALLEDIK